MTYQDLVQLLINELGLSGIPILDPGAITNNAVTGTTIPELNRACIWIRDACLAIDNQWQDWKYLWVKYGPQTGNSGDTTIPAPQQAVRQWDPEMLRQRTTSVGGPTYCKVNWYPRKEFWDRFDPDNSIGPGPPEAFTVMPDNSILFASPLDQSYDFLAEFWQRPVQLVNSADTPLMPAEYHRVIMCRAAVMYGNREDAPEIITGLETEMLEIMDKLTSDQLEGWELKRSSIDRYGRHRHQHLDGFLA